MEFFVHPDSIVRKIWGKSDTVLFIFAGASAEFALNKAVDWLYFTGKLPADPIGRLFSTVAYARQIVFAELNHANKAIDSMAAIHAAVEAKRGYSIPDWAYRDVLFMLIHYSIASFELLERKLGNEEKEEVFNVFYNVGKRMRLKDLPKNYAAWLEMRKDHLADHLEKSKYTTDLYKQYKKHLGATRYLVLKQAQLLVCPNEVISKLPLGKIKWFTPVVALYKFSRTVKLDGIAKAIILPNKYKRQIKDLDIIPS